MVRPQHGNNTKHTLAQQLHHHTTNTACTALRCRQSRISPGKLHRQQRTSTATYKQAGIRAGTAYKSTQGDMGNSAHRLLQRTNQLCQHRVGLADGPLPPDMERSPMPPKNKMLEVWGAVGDMECGESCRQDCGTRNEKKGLAHPHPPTHPPEAVCLGLIREEHHLQEVVATKER